MLHWDVGVGRSVFLCRAVSTIHCQSAMIHSPYVQGLVLRRDEGWPPSDGARHDQMHWIAMQSTGGISKQMTYRRVPRIYSRWERPRDFLWLSTWLSMCSPFPSRDLSPLSPAELPSSSRYDHDFKLSSGHWCNRNPFRRGIHTILALRCVVSS